MLPTRIFGCNVPLLTLYFLLLFVQLADLIRLCGLDNRPYC